MGTRSGNLDPAILQFIMNKYGYTADEMLNILNKKSGVLGISGVGSDFRDLEKAAKEGNERAQLALDKFAYEVRKYIGSYAAAMGARRSGLPGLHGRRRRERPRYAREHLRGSRVPRRPCGPREKPGPRQGDRHLRG